MSKSKKKFTEKQVSEYIHKDISAAIALLKVIQDDPEILRLVVSILTERANAEPVPEVKPEPVI